MVGPWRSSNDSPLLNSDSVFRRRGLLLLHEIAHPQLENFAWFTALRLRPGCWPDPYFVSPIFHHRLLLPDAHSSPLPLPCLLPSTATPLLRSIQSAYCPRPPRQRLPSDGFFERAPQPPLRLKHSTKARLRKSTSVTGARSGNPQSPKIRLPGVVQLGHACGSI